MKNSSYHRDFPRSRQYRIRAGRILNMQTAKFLVGAVLIISISGCQTPESKSVIIGINIEQNVKNLNPLNICDLNGELRYVPLKDNSILLKVAAESEFSEDKILVSDRANCLLYDYQGNRLAVIGRKGKGPGEYNVIMKMKFGIQNQIYIQSSGDFLVFDLNGNYLRMFKPEVNPEVITPVGAGTMYSWAPFNDSLFIGQVSNDSGQEKYKAVFFNRAGKTVKSVDNLIFLNKRQRYTSDDNCMASIYKLNGKTSFKEILNDTVFRVNDQFIFEPVYCLNLGKYKQPKEVRELPFAEMNQERKKYIFISKVFESPDYLFLDCNFQDHNPAKRAAPVNYKDAFGNTTEWWFYPAGMLGIYDKSSDKLVFAEPVKSDDRLTNSGLRNDYDGGVNFFPKKMVNDSTLAMWVDAWEFKAHVKSRAFKNSTPRYPEKKKELEKLANGLNDSDNPVLILCTFKK